MDSKFLEEKISEIIAYIGFTIDDVQNEFEHSNESINIKYACKAGRYEATLEIVENRLKTLLSCINE